MADVFSTEVSDRICGHMNDDHADAVLLYAKVYGHAPEAVTAQMTQIDAQGMDLAVQEPGATRTLRIPFDHELKDSEDAHHTLIDMVKQARSRT